MFAHPKAKIWYQKHQIFSMPRHFRLTSSGDKPKSSPAKIQLNSGKSEKQVRPNPHGLKTLPFSSKNNVR